MLKVNRRVMNRRVKRTSLLIGLLGLASLSVAAISLGDAIDPDADTVAIGNQSSRNLGTVNPGATVTPDPPVSFELRCNGNFHANNGQTVGLNFSAAASTAPAGGTVSATNATIGAVPSAWPDDGSSCASAGNPSPLQDNGNSTVTIGAPKSAGNKTYTVSYAKTVPPPDVTGGNVTVTFTLTVPNVAPTINSFTGDTTATVGDTKGHPSPPPTPTRTR